jgi:hypothetical protein
MPVCIPNATAIPRMAMKTTNGTRPPGRLFLLSVAAKIHNNRIMVPINWTPLVRRLVAC